jgi:hypothetical protein
LAHPLQTPNEYAAQLQNSLRQAFQRVRTNLAAAHNRQKQLYDQHIHGTSFHAGDLVWLLNTVVPPGQSRKLHFPWSGPYRVLQQFSDCTYRIQSCDGKKRLHIVHFNRLKPCPPDLRVDDVDVTQPTNHQGFGYNLLVDSSEDELPDEETTHDQDLPVPVQVRQYPSRNRHPPDRLIDSLSI